jgi:phosphatidylglycerophosphate synthase
MLARLLRTWSPDLLRPTVTLLLRGGITPNQLTLAGLMLAIIAGTAIAHGQLAIAAALVLLSGILDALDGELARQGNCATPHGAFFDSIADHYGDFAIYLGVAVFALQSHDEMLVVLILAAMFGSLAGSQIRSRAGMIGLDTKDVGIFTRAERIIVLVLGLAAGLLTPALAVLAFANNLSALQRLGHVAKAKPPRQDR